MRWILIAVGMVGLSGCDAAVQAPATESLARLEAAAPAGGRAREYSAAMAPRSNNDDDAVAFGEMPSMMRGAMGSATAPLPQDKPPPAPAGMARKIIYTAEVALVVEEFAKAEPEVGRLVQQYKGYIADMQLLGSPGSKRSARWKVRIPVDGFESFLLDVAKLGELERNSRKSEDISETYYDLEARIKNKTVEEARLQKILEENTGKIEEVLKVETELSRVRGEIEQAQGRLRMFENLTSLTTVSIDIHERETFEPPPPVVASFPTQIERAFGDSLNALISLGKGTVLFLVSVALWVPLWIVGIALGYLLLRAFIRWIGRNAGRIWTLARAQIGPPRAAP